MGNFVEQTVIQNLTIRQGVTLEVLALVYDVNYVPLDMTGYDVEPASIVGNICNPKNKAVLASFTIDILDNTGIQAAIDSGECHLSDTQIDDLLSDLAGKCYLLIRLSADVSVTLPKGTWEYDIKMVDPTGFAFTPYAGAVHVLVGYS